MERHEQVFDLFLQAFEAWGPARDFDLAIILTDQAIKAGLALGADDPLGERIVRASYFLQGMAAVRASPGPMKPTRKGKTPPK